MRRRWGAPSLWVLAALACGVVAAPARAQRGSPDAGVTEGGASEDEGWTDEDEAWAEDEEAPEGGESQADEGEPEEEAPEEEQPPAEEEQASPAETEEEHEEEQEAEGQEAGLLPPGQTVPYQPPAPAAGENDFSLILPPFIYAREGPTESIALFPLFYFRQSPLTTELLIPPYYAMRGPQNWDVLLPLFFWYRGEGHHTWVVPPVWSHQAADGFDFGVAPFLMTGRHDDHHYTLIPPLLTIDWGSEHERFTFAALFWRIQERYTEHWGLFPLLWVENTERSSYIIQPPFFFRFEDRNEHTTLTVIPPFYHRDEPNGSYFGIPPLFHHNSGPGHTSTTIFPLLSHYSEEADAMRLVLGGVFWYWRDHGDETIVTPFYQRFRGATEMDAVAPFFFSIRDPRTNYSALAIPPLIWHFEDPGSVATVVFPFFGHFEERGRNETWITPLVAQHHDYEHHDDTTWIFPTIQISNWHNGDAVNIHPIWYYESVPSHRFAVLAPLWLDYESFEGTHNRYTVAFPFFWRFREGNTTSTLVLNVYHRERVRADSSEWEIDIFPFFSYGESSLGGHWWKIFFGLAGYERRGPYGITTLFYVPFQTDGPPLPTSGGTNH